MLLKGKRRIIKTVLTCALLGGGISYPFINEGFYLKGRCPDYNEDTCIFTFPAGTKIRDPRNGSVYTLPDNNKVDLSSFQTASIKIYYSIVDGVMKAYKYNDPVLKLQNILVCSGRFKNSYSPHVITNISMNCNFTLNGAKPYYTAALFSSNSVLDGLTSEKTGLSYAYVGSLSYQDFSAYDMPKGVQQSLCSYGGYIFVVFDSGWVGVADTDYSIVNAFALDLSEEQLEGFHGANSSFGTEFYSESSSFPLLYVSETTGDSNCYVFDISTTDSSMVQTISFDGTFGKADGKNYHDYLFDRDHDEMYVIGYYDFGATDDRMIVKKVKAPILSDGETVSLTDEDVLDSLYSYYIDVIQGCALYDGMLYVANNDGDLAKGVAVFDLSEKALYGNIPMPFLNEPEGITIIDNYLIAQDYNATDSPHGSLFEIIL